MAIPEELKIIEVKSLGAEYAKQFHAQAHRNFMLMQSVMENMDKRNLDEDLQFSTIGSLLLTQLADTFVMLTTDNCSLHGLDTSEKAHVGRLLKHFGEHLIRNGKEMANEVH